MSTTTLNVLLIEDDDGEALLIEKMLSLSVDVSFAVTRAVTLTAGLQISELLHPDIVLLDLSLPDFHGYDTVVEYTKRSDIPFIVLTGNDDLQMASRTVNLGAQDYMLKNELRSRKLELALSLARQRSDLKQLSRKLEHSSRTHVFQDRQKATISMVRPGVEMLIRYVQELQTFVKLNAPQLADDVRALAGKFQAASLIHEIQETLRLHDSAEMVRPQSFSDTPGVRIVDEASKEIDKLFSRRNTLKVERPKDFVDAEKSLLTILERREAGYADSDA